MSFLLRFSVRRPWVVVAITAVLAASALWFIPGIELRLDGRSLIPEDHPSMQASDLAAERFRLRDLVVLGLSEEGGEPYSPALLAAATRLSRELDGIEGVVSGSVASLATVPRLFVEDGVLDLRPLLDRGEVDAARAARVQRETEALGLDDGVLIARDGRAVAIYAQVEPEADRYRMRADIEALARELTTAELQIHFSGTALAQAVLGEAAALDLMRLVPLVILVVGIVLILAYRHPAPTLVTLAEVGVSLILTVGVMGLTGQAVFVTTLALPVVLVVIGVSDDVYALNRYFDLAWQKRGRPVAEVVVEGFSAVRKPILLTAVTTMVGLSCLNVTALEPQRVFGTFGALSVLFSTALTFSLVPALLVILDPRISPAKARAHQFGEAASRLLAGALRWLRPVGVILVVVVLSLVSLGLSTRLTIGDNWVRNLPPESDIVRGDTAINRLLAGTNTLDLMLDSGEVRGFLTPDRLAALGRLEEALLASESVGAVESLYTQVVRLNAALEGVDYFEYRESLLAGERQLDEAQIEQALLLQGSLRRSPLVERLDAEYRRSRLTVFVRSADYGRIAEVLEIARTAGAPTFVGEEAIVPFGDGWIGHTTIRLLVVGQVFSIALAVIFDTLLLALMFRSLRTAVMAVSPVVFGVVLVFGALALSGAPLGTANSMFAAIALGIGVDYSIHLVAYLRETMLSGLPRRDAIWAAIQATGPAILTSAVAIAIGFLVLAGSEVLPNRQLGILVSLSMAVCAIMTLILVPSLSLLRSREP